MVYDKIVTPLADIVLAGNITNKGKVGVVMEEGDVKIVMRSKVTGG